MRKELVSTFLCMILIIVACTPCIKAENGSINSSSIQINGYEYKTDKSNFLCTTSDHEQHFVPGELIVKFNKEILISRSKEGGITTGADVLDKINSQLRVCSIEKLFDDTSPSSLQNVFKFTFPPDINIFSLSKQYERDTAVEYVQLNYVYQACTEQNPANVISKELSSDYHRANNQTIIPNDPLFNQQWALNQSNDCDIDTPEAWSIETGNPNITIAVIDSGVDYNHQDLAANIWNNTDEIPHNGIDDDHNGFIDDTMGWDFVNNDNDPMDDYDHGTFCSGIAAAVTNNSIGIAGVCWNCKIMSLKGLDKKGVGDDLNLIKCILYAAHNNANIISMSWGGYPPDDMLYNALSYAFSQGVVLVAGAGNENMTFPFYPAGYDPVISVASTTSADKKDKYSNYGNDVDVAAPGVDILSTWPGNGYQKRSGTSAACPFVAGLAALLLSKYPGCPYPAQMVKSVIEYTTDPLQGNYSFGRINAYQALTMEPCAVDLEALLNWEDVKGTIDIRGTAWGEDLLYFTLEIGGGENPSSWTVLRNSSTPDGGVLYTLDTWNLEETVYMIRLQAVFSHGTYSKTIAIHVNNEADGGYDADIYVSNCYNSATPGWGVTRFTRIQDGIDKAGSGDTVFVFEGVYLEDVVIEGSSKSSITLQSQSQEFTIIRGYLNLTKVNQVTVRGFSIRDGIGTYGDINTSYLFYWYEVLLSSASKCMLADCKIVNYYSETPVYTIIVIFSSNNIISDNDIYERCFIGGGPAVFSMLSSKLVISGNTFVRSAMGVGIRFSHSSIIENNTFLFCGNGVFLQSTHNNLIYKNKIINMLGGAVVMFWLGCSRNTIVANSCENTAEYGGMIIGWIGNIGGNHIYLNNFERVGVADDCLNRYYKPEGLLKGEGNYWSMYELWYKIDYGTEPTDNNNDGFWDRPLLIDTMMLQSFHIKHLDHDRFPFVNPIDTANITVPEAEVFIHGIISDFNSDRSREIPNSSIQALSQSFHLNQQIFRIHLLLGQQVMKVNQFFDIIREQSCNII